MGLLVGIEGDTSFKYKVDGRLCYSRVKEGEG
jgi:hypothetical protein